jgi:hypothetical protein
MNKTPIVLHNLAEFEAYAANPAQIHGDTPRENIMVFITPQCAREIGLKDDGITYPQEHYDKLIADSAARNGEDPIELKAFTVSLDSK